MQDGDPFAPVRDTNVYYDLSGATKATDVIRAREDMEKAAYLSAGAHGKTLEEIKADLNFKMILRSPSTIHSRGNVEVDLVFHNRSSSVTYPLVLPSGGSSQGRVETHVYFTATLETSDGTSKPVPKAILPLGCGNYGNWWENARLLKPGVELLLKSWIPSQSLIFQDAGHVKLIAHYSDQTGAYAKEVEESAIDLGLMKGMPAYELVSPPTEFDVNENPTPRE